MLLRTSPQKWRIFKGVLATAGKIRSVNIKNREWVLKGDSVTYGSADTIKQSLIRDFIDEREFDYGKVAPRKAIAHFARFIALIWQVHPFGEGNTRTVAVFAIKYLASIGYRVSNNMFKDNSWFFRNALVRANYADYQNGVKRDWSYLEDFFKNLLLGENNRMKSRYLLIGLSEDDKRKIEELTEKKDGQKVVRKRRLSEKGCQKTADRIVALLTENGTTTQGEMAKSLGISRQAVQKHLANLKSAGRLRRVGPDKGGHWEIV